MSPIRVMLVERLSTPVMPAGKPVARSKSSLGQPGRRQLGEEQSPIREDSAPTDGRRTIEEVLSPRKLGVS
jgi:hypothetical protein